MSGHARLFAAITAATLASVAGAAVATFNYSAVESDPFGVTFNEVVTATDPVGSVRVSGSLTEINTATWGIEAVLEVMSPDFQFVYLTPFDVLGFVGTVTATDVTESFPFEVASAAGNWSFTFFEDFDDGGDGLADAVWDTVEINLEGPLPPTDCPAGLGNMTFTNVSSDAGIGGAGNSIVGGDFGVAGNINLLRVSGEFNAFSPSWRSEVAVRATAPSGANYNILLGNGLPDSAGPGQVIDLETTIASESGTGFWTFEFYETFVDGVSPDATWSSICFSVDLLENTPPTGTGLATPDLVASDGVETTILTVSVLPGDNPVSTGITVNVDASAIGGGTLILLDDGVAPDAVAGDGIYSVETTVAPGTPTGAAVLPFNIADAQGRNGGGNIDIFVAPPAPGCLPGAATLSILGAQSDAIYGGGGTNTIVNHDFGVASDINVIRLSGRATAFAPSWMADAEVAITTPEGATYFIYLGGGIGAGTFDFGGEIALPALASGTGNWTLEFYEDFVDNISPETTYPSFCLSVDAVGACCTDSGCVVTDITNCTDVLGGTFIGAGTNCGSPGEMTADGAAFEDISGTGFQVFFPGDDDSVANVSWPFAFNYFGVDYFDGNISTNGNFQFGPNNSAAFGNTPIPTAGVPNNALYVMWDDLNLFGSGIVYTDLRGTPGVDQRFIIQWTAGQYNGFNIVPNDLSTFQVVLFEDGYFEFRYLTVSGEDGTAGIGDTTTFGFENADGSIGITLNETRDSLAAQAPISFRGTSAIVDTGLCGNGCPPCAADYDNNGGVDGGDLAAFFTDFETGEACADVDGNGGVDGGDLGFFFFVFEQGGCE